MRFSALSFASFLSLAAAAGALADVPAADAAPGEATLTPSQVSSTTAEIAPAAAGAPADASPPAARPPVVPTPALIEKLGKGDRLFLAGDHRNALFAYQDAVYLQPGYAPAHVRLGRAYLALRYPEQAVAQAQAALAADPGNAEAAELLASAAAAPPRSGPAEPAPAASGPRVFRLVAPEGDALAPGEAAAAGPPPGPSPGR